MDLNNYQTKCLRTECDQNKSLDRYCPMGLVYDQHDKSYLRPIRVTHAVVGLFGELAEVAEIYRNCRNSPPTDFYEKMTEEFGDMCWYLALMSDALGFTLEDALGVSALIGHKHHGDLLDLTALCGKLGTLHQKWIHYGTMTTETFTEKATVQVGLILASIIATCYSMQGRIDPEEILRANILKLAKRYPTKFTQEDCENRDTDAEMEEIKTVTGIKLPAKTEEELQTEELARLFNPEADLR